MERRALNSVQQQQDANIAGRGTVSLRQIIPRPVRKQVRRLRRFSEGLRHGRSRLESVASLADGRHTADPILSVIVPVYNVEHYVAETLDSVLNQTLRELEIIVVDDGSTDSSGEIVNEYATKDSRIRVITKSNAGLGSARNTGIAVAKGKYLTFLDSDDTLPPSAYEDMVKTLNVTGSDFVVGAVRRVTHGKFSTPQWCRITHEKDRLGITIDDFSLAMQDIIACNRMFRTDFWRERIGNFPEGVAYEDHAPMVAAYVRASKFDMLRRVTYYWRIREDKKSIGQQKHSIQNLKDRKFAKEQALRVISTEASSGVRNAWLGRVVDLDIPAFMGFALRSDGEYRSVVQDFAAAFINVMNEDAWQYVRFNQRLRVMLMAQGRWDEIPRVDAFIRDVGGIPSTYIADGEIYLDFDALGVGTDRQALPALRLGEVQTPLRACIEKAYWDEEGLHIRGWAFIPFVASSGNDRQFRLFLRNMDSGKTIDLDHVPDATGAATRWAAHSNFAYDDSEFKAVIGRALIGRLCEESGSSVWQLRARVTSRGVTREREFAHVIKTGSAGWLRAKAYPEVPIRVVPVVSADHGLKLELRSSLVAATSLEVLPSRGKMRGTIQFAETYAQVPLSVRVSGFAAGHLEFPLRQTSDRSYDFDIELPMQEFGEQQHNIGLNVRVMNQEGPNRRIVWSAGLPEARRIGDGDCHWEKSTHGYVGIAARPQYIEATDLQITDTSISVALRYRGLSESVMKSLVMQGSRGNLFATNVEFPEVGSCTAEFSMLNMEDDCSPLLQMGKYKFIARTEDGVEIACKLAEPLADILPLHQLTSHHRLTVSHVGLPKARYVSVTVAPPLAGDEEGHYAQRQLRKWYRAAQPTPIDAVLFQCYRGEVATDSQAAIHRELRSRNDSLLLYWGVSHMSVPLPEGGIPLLIGSRKWYEVLGAARYLCNNIDFDRYFERKPHQKFLQTFHGYPFKSMGIHYWESQGVLEQNIRHEVQRRNDAWTSILVPSDFCEAIYRREYDFTGEVLAVGYPRNDDLLSGNILDRRVAIRKLLGIEENQTAVMYAPTWREANATGAWSAKIFDDLDVSLLAQELGDDHVILVRGHNFNQRESARHSRSARVLDVTDHPEINDLIIAADVAIMDYSSLRFDWAITRKPMIFFVPDKEDYFQSRPSLYPYDETAPGPQLTKTSQVVETLRNLDGLKRDYDSAITEFNVKYNDRHDGLAAKRVVDSFFDV